MNYSRKNVKGEMPYEAPSCCVEMMQPENSLCTSVDSESLEGYDGYDEITW